MIRSTNIEGITAVSREQIIISMLEENIDVMILQETWTVLTKEIPDGFLFLLHGTPQQKINA